MDPITLLILAAVGGGLFAAFGGKKSTPELPPLPYADNTPAPVQAPASAPKSTPKPTTTATTTTSPTGTNTPQWSFSRTKPPRYTIDGKQVEYNPTSRQADGYKDANAVQIANHLANSILAIQDWLRKNYTTGERPTLSEQDKLMQAWKWWAQLDRNKQLAVIELLDTRTVITVSGQRVSLKTWLDQRATTIKTKLGIVGPLSMKQRWQSLQ